MRQDSLGIAGVGLRFAAALVLVLVTFNPTGWSYFHWLSRSIGAIDPPVVLAGVALVIGWGVYLSATLRSLGLMGMLLWAAFFGALVWTAVFYGWLSLSNLLMTGGSTFWNEITAPTVVSYALQIWDPATDNALLIRPLAGMTRFMTTEVSIEAIELLSWWPATICPISRARTSASQSSVGFRSATALDAPAASSSAQRTRAMAPSSCRRIARPWRGSRRGFPDSRASGCCCRSG